MHSKTVKFITQLRHATQGRTTQHKQAKYPKSIQISDNQPAYIRQVPVAMLQQMFEVTAYRFHAVTQTFVPLIDSVVDDTLLQTRPLGNQTSLQIVQVSDRRLVHLILHHTPDLAVYRVEVWAVWRPQVWDDELRR